MSQILRTVVVIGIDLGKNSFHVVGLDGDGAPVLRQKWSRGQVEARLANMPPCLIGMESTAATPGTQTSAAAATASLRLTTSTRSSGVQTVRKNARRWLATPLRLANAR